MSKVILGGNKAKKNLKRGVDILANAVKVTLGPQGRTVMVERPFGDPLVTKDGISVAKEILLPNRVQNMGAQFVRVAAAKTNEKAGDGTTTATVLTQAIIKHGMKAIKEGGNPVAVQRGITRGAELVIEQLKNISKQVGTTGIELNQIAYISSNSDEEVGKLIGEAYTTVGKDGVISVEESKNTTTYVELANGMKFGSGYMHPYFVNDTKKGEVSLKDVMILITEDKLTLFNNVLTKILDKTIGKDKSLLIIGEVEGQALETLLMNVYQNKIKLVICKAPGFGEKKIAAIEDIAIATGATIASRARGKNLAQMTPADFGTAESLTMDFHDTILTGAGGKSEVIIERIEELEALKEPAENDYEVKHLEKRIAALSGGVGVIYVGAPTTAEMKEKMDRIEDAKNATRAALEEGVVPGGGMALINAGDLVDPLFIDNIGVKQLMLSLDAPFKCIVENAGVDSTKVLSEVVTHKGTSPGYNAKTFMYSSDMFESGIIDPLKVTRNALENAASAAGILLTSECTITTLLDKEPIQQSKGRQFF